MHISSPCIATLLMTCPLFVACGADEAELDTAPVDIEELGHLVDDPPVDIEVDVAQLELDVDAGRELFLHSWSKFDERARGGDGLGPLYNAASCVACHSQGAVGGAGGSHNNVVIGDGRVFHRHGGGPVPAASASTGLASLLGSVGTIGASGGTVSNVFGPSGLGTGLNSALGGLRGASIGGDGTAGGDSDDDDVNLKIGTPSVFGRLDKTMINRVVARVRSQLRYCIERELRRAPMEDGKITVKLDVDDDGKATATIGESSVNNASIEGCLSRVLSRVRYPSGPGVGSVVTVPLSFVAKKSAAPPAPPAPPSVVVERNTPALFGVGLIEEIPDDVIEMNAAVMSTAYPEITGKVGRTPEGRVTRFGWKGDVPDLVTFVSRACSVELGLEVPGSPQPGRRKKGNVPELDINLDDLENLVAFVKALPKPIEKRTAIASEGAELFDSVGCTACHAPVLGDVDGIYSDLVLHDMGSELDDNASVGYYGSPPVGGSNEWRTPPLWGVRDSAPYMHDGRARSLERAIALHGGEAAKIRDAYNALRDDEQEALIAFLESLQAPH